MADATDDTLLNLTADIVAAYLANNRLTTQEVAPIIQQVHSTLASLGQPAEPEAEPLKPAVAVRSSVKPDYLVSLESGKKMKMLKRYLMTNYGMTPEDYRKKWGLPADYPMVAPNYSESRKDLAKKIGLGRKPGGSEAETGAVGDAAAAERKTEETVAPAPRRRSKAAAAPNSQAADAPETANETAPAPKRRGRKPATAE